MPAVSSRSLAPQGMPCSGPRYLPAAISSSACLCLLQRRVAGQRDDAAQLGIVFLQACQIDVGQPLRGKLAALDPARELGDAGEGDVFVIRRQCPGIGAAENEFAAGRQLLRAWEYRVPAGPRGDLLGIGTLCGPTRRSYSAAIEHAPIVRALGQFFRLELHLHQLLCLSEGVGGDLRPDCRRCAEGRWSARRGFGLLALA